MSKYRKKPVVIEAVRIHKGMNSNAPQWFRDGVSSGELIPHGMGAITRDMPWVEIYTLNGVVRGNAGEWLVRGVNGEFYPCANDIFLTTYEPA